MGGTGRESRKIPALVLGWKPYGKFQIKTHNKKAFFPPALGTGPGLMPGNVATVRIFTVCTLLLLQSSWSAWADGLQRVHYAIPAAVQTAKLVGPTMHLEKLNLAIGLPLRNAETLTNLLQQIYNPASPNFHH